MENPVLRTKKLDFSPSILPPDNVSKHDHIFFRIYSKELIRTAGCKFGACLLFSHEFNRVGFSGFSDTKSTHKEFIGACFANRNLTEYYQETDRK